MRITKSNINKFIRGSIMECSGKGIVSIDYITDGITHLYCHNNQLTNIPNLPESLTRLYCHNNQ